MGLISHDWAEIKNSYLQSLGAKHLPGYMDILNNKKAM